MSVHFPRSRFSLQLTAAAALAAACGVAAAQQVQVVKIGHAGPISGGIAHIGKDTENGVRLAVEDLNAQGLVIGGKKIKFELAAEDDAGDVRLPFLLEPRGQAGCVAEQHDQQPGGERVESPEMAGGAGAEEALDGPGDGVGRGPGRLVDQNDAVSGFVSRRGVARWVHRLPGVRALRALRVRRS